MGKKTLVLGASLKAERYSNKAIRRLMQSDYEVVAIGNRKGNVAGVNTQTDKHLFKDIDTVTLYLSEK